MQPLATAYTHPGAAAERSAQQAKSEDFQPVPRVVAVGGESTISGGGVRSAASDAGLHSDADGAHDSHHGSSKSSKSNDSGLLGGLLDDVKKDLDIASDVKEQAKKAASSAASAAKDAANSSGVKSVSSAARNALNDIRAFSSSSSSSSSSTQGSSSKSSSSSSSKPKQLSDDERTGAYVLGAILAGGFLLGGLGKKTSAFAPESAKKEPTTLAGKAVAKIEEKTVAVVKPSPSSASSGAAAAAPSTEAKSSVNANGSLSQGRGRVGKALGDFGKTGAAPSQPAAAVGAQQATTNPGHFASAAGVVGSAPRRT